MNLLALNGCLAKMFPRLLSLTMLGVLLLLGSCTNKVVVEGSLPTPLVKQIPARIGVHYPESFRSFVHHEELEDDGTWAIDLGSQNLSFFKNLLQALFISAREVGERPLPAAAMAGLDGVLEMRIKQYGFLTPTISGLGFYSVSIEYEVALYDSKDAMLGRWTVVGYGKREGGMFSADDAINEATALAIRDGGARIAIELIDLPAVQTWLAGLPSGATQGSEAE